MPDHPPATVSGAAGPQIDLTSCDFSATDAPAEEPTRPVLRYHGAKWRIAPWIIACFPDHDRYVEPYGGGAGVLLRKPRSRGEVYNDLDGEIVNVFRVLQDPIAAERLYRRLVLTPYSRAEFLRAYEPASDPVDAAAKTLTRAAMGHGSAAMSRRHRTGFRSRATSRSSMPASEWSTWPDHVWWFVERLRGVVIENRAALEVLAQHDSPATLYYVDPPYVAATRSLLTSKNGKYQHFSRHDMDDAEHERLAACLHDLAGLVVLSGYPSELYERLYADWPFIARHAKIETGATRIERLWFNPACARAQRQIELPLTWPS